MIVVSALSQAMSSIVVVSIVEVPCPAATVRVIFIAHQTRTNEHSHALPRIPCILIARGTPVNLTSERWQRVATIYELAVRQDEATRDAFLAEVCAADQELRYEVESLLQPGWRKHRPRSFFLDNRSTTVW